MTTKIERAHTGIEDLIARLKADEAEYVRQGNIDLSSRRAEMAFGAGLALRVVTKLEEESDANQS